MKVVEEDVGKIIRTSTGKPIGRVGEVSEKGEFQVVATSERRVRHRPADEIRNEEGAYDFRPEDIEMVTEEAVWLQL